MDYAMAYVGEHEVRIVGSERGHRGECETCEWNSAWHRTRGVAEFVAMRHADDPQQHDQRPAP